MTDAATCCPRCAHTVIEHLFTSPVPGVWDVLQCGRCLYCWRTTEPDRRTRRDAYPDGFKLTADDIGNAPEVPAVPPLAVRAVQAAAGGASGAGGAGGSDRSGEP